MVRRLSVNCASTIEIVWEETSLPFTVFDKMQRVVSSPERSERDDDLTDLLVGF